MWPFSRKPQTETKSLADPEDWLAEMLGVVPVAAGVSLTGETALRVPAVSAAVRAISEAAASLDITVTTPDGATELTDDPVRALLRGEANGWTSGYELIRDLIVGALLRDHGAMAWVNRVSGRPVEIIPYRPGVIAVDYDQATGEPTYSINSVPVPSENIIHLRSPFGRAPVTLAKEAIAVAFVLERHAARLFGRGARPSGALMFPRGMGEESVKKARTAWRASHEGDDTGGQTAILYDGASFQPFTLASTDAQFLENRTFQILEIARAFRVPPQMLYDLGRATWANGEQQGREFLSYTLEPWLRALEAALARGLFLPDERAERVIRFDRDDLTRADLSTRATVINSLIASRVINPNESRDWLGLQPYEGGDEFANPNITAAAPQSEEEPIRAVA